MKESGDDVGNVELPAISSSMTILWGGISLKGSTDLHMLASGTHTALRDPDEVLGAIVFMLYAIRLDLLVQWALGC